MTSSADGRRAGRRAAAGLLHRRARQERDHARSTRCCAATRRSSCPPTRSRGSSPATCARAFSPRRAGPAPQTLEEYRALFAGARRGPARGGGLLLLSVVQDRRRGDRRGPARGPHRGDPARARELPALAAPAAAADPRGERPGLPHRDLARGRAPSRAGASRAARTGPQLLQYSEHVRYVEQLRRYHEVFASEQVLVLIYDDFRADNDATARRVLELLAGLRRPSRWRRSRPTPACACARRRSMKSCTPSRSGAARPGGPSAAR